MVMREAGPGADDPGEFPDDESSGLRLVDPDEPAPPPVLALNKSGLPKKNLANTIDLLSLHEAWQGVVAYDEFRQCVVKLRAPPVRDQDEPTASKTGEWTEADSVRTCAWLSSRTFPGHRLDTDVSMVDRALLAVSERNVFHPVRDWFDRIQWDGKQRLDGLFPKYFRAHDTQFTREAGKRWMISAVARIFRPGCQVKYMPVLESPQDYGKSTGLQALIGAGADGSSWYADTGLTIGNKDSYQCLRAKLGYEWSDLNTMRTARDIESLKGFISSVSDNYRPTWGRRNKDFPRQCVFIGTTNEERWLADPTGGSRFWPIRCYPLHILREELAQDRELLWAEAVARFKSNERWWFDAAQEPDMMAAAREEQAERRESDPWKELVGKWLKTPTIPDGQGTGTRSIVRADEGVNSTTILLGALDMKKGDCNRSHETRLGYVMKDLGWVRRQVRDAGKREYRFFRVGEVG